MNHFEKITITCSDHYHLSARFYPTQVQSTLDPILICPATGITKTFYHAFAEWLNTQGYSVMSFDFRGIGESLHGKLKDSTASIQEWGQLDLPAAIDALLNKTNAEQVYIIGHSAGGQLLGIAPNHSKVKKLIAIAGSTGHVKHLKGRTKVLAPVMFKLIFPLSRIIKGYGTTKFIGMGENLPKDVAKQWAEFCGKPGYIMNAVGKTIFEDFHTDIRTPITSLWATDDEIATNTNVKDFLALYPHTKTEMIEIIPAQYQHKQIGHMLMFKKSHQNLWPLIKEQLNT